MGNQELLRTSPRRDGALKLVLLLDRRSISFLGRRCIVRGLGTLCWVVVIVG